MPSPTTEKPYLGDVSQNYPKDGHLNPEQKDGSLSPYRPATPRRRSNESSNAGSEYDASINESRTKPAQTLYFLYSKSGYNLRIVDADTGVCLYYVDNSIFTHGKPDMTLFKGNDKQGCPIAGVARWSHMFSRSIDIGLGDPGVHNQEASSIPWETLKSNSSVKQSEHSWSMSGDPQRRVYQWRRTHHVGIEAEHNSWSNLNYKLIEKDTGEVLATFASNHFKSWKKMGKLTYRADLGEDWLLMALLTYLALLEESRRRSRSRRTYNGGGS